MTTSTDSTRTRLAYERAGAGAAVVLLHGLTFDRTTWRPIIDQIDGALDTIAIDLPAHGRSPGPPATISQLAATVHDLLTHLDIGTPVMVGHSFGAAVAALYAARYPCLGMVMVDSGPEQQPFAELAQRAAPMLQGSGFDDAWAMIEASLGLHLIPQPTQDAVRAAHHVDQDVVLGYWDQLLTTPPADFQAFIDTAIAGITVPVLAVYGHRASEGDRQRFQAFSDVTVEEHPGDGHFVHLVDPARFTRSLRRFVAHCTATHEPATLLDAHRAPADRSRSGP